MESYNTIVLGVGGMGSATVYYLAKRGIDVLGLERFDIPHSQGSSHGITRIIRIPQFKDPLYVPLVRASLDLWKELEKHHDYNLLYQTGTLDFGLPDGDVYTGSKKSCDIHGIDHTILTGQDLSKRLGGYDVPNNYMGVFQPDGGFLHSEQCVVAHTEAAHTHDATIQARERVVDWEASESGVRISTDRNDYTADTLVTTAGAWTGSLFPTLSEYLEPERQVLGWFQPVDREQFRPDNFPVFVADVPEGNYYGFPVFEVPGVKIGKHHHQGETGTPIEVSRDPTQEDEELLRSFMNQYTIGAGPTMRLESCMYTNTPDRDFILDQHPNHANIVIGSGFSGHGFKFASVIGKILADLAINKTSDYPVGEFSVSRFE